MVKYPEYKSQNYPEIAERILKFWNENHTFQQSVSTREGNPTFTFYEGPPSANGTPGIHHVMARTIKDIFCRYKTMQGFQVNRKGGWDTHGLPVELQVEKELGITKEDIGKKISVEEYNKKCRETVMRFKAEWDDLTQKMGYWVDLDNPYITFENSYIESCWYILKKLFEKNYLYKGYTIQPYSPAAGTGLSSHELNQPGCYKDVKDTSIVAQFKVIRNQKSEKLFANLGGSAKPFSHRELLKSINDPEVTETETNINWNDVYVLAWTTTPWTLPSNSALAVGEKITYIKIKTFNPYTFKPVVIVMAKDLVSKYFHAKSAEIPLESYNAGDKVIPFQLLEEYTGKDLIGIEYEQLMPSQQTSENGLRSENEWRKSGAFRIITGDFVSTEDGTGVVHIAPTFGADDYRVAKLANIPAITITDAEAKELPLVDKQGKFIAQFPEFGGMFVKNYDNQDESNPAYKSTDVLISIKLKTENKAFKVEKYEHSYPHCWRTDKPILYYPLESWFIKTTALKDKMVDFNKTINWKPESTGTGRFGNWLENLVDWNLSRSRYWGTPLPIWVSEDGKEMKCIGSIAELKSELEKANQTLGLQQITELKDLHRPFVDEIFLVDIRGQKMIRQTDLIDVWFDSGAMPYAQWNYPFSQNSLNGVYPADFISEGVDQTRGWFFTLHALAVMLNDIDPKTFTGIAFKNVVSTGLVLDKNGEKMSKRKGNVINPFTTLEKYGPDATRWYMIANSNPWDNLKFDLDGIAETQRKFFGTLHNTYNFFALYANLDSFVPDINLLNDSKNLTEADKWILSKLNSLIAEVTKAYDEYEPTKAARALTDFVCDDMSNWYVRLNRKRFWLAKLNDDKRAAYTTLYTCLETIVKLAAPIAPFYTEELYQNLTKNNTNSVHLSAFPKSDKLLINNELEERMAMAQTVTTLVHSIRKNNNLRVRLPLNKIMIPVLQPKTKAQILAVSDLIKTEVNIKNIEFIEDTTGIVTKKVKPNFQTLGKTYGKFLKEIGANIAALHQNEIANIEKGNPLEFSVGDTLISISKADLLISTEDIPGWKVATEGEITVALDVTVTEELKKEGIARDFVNRVQNYRKDNGFDVTDKIKIVVENKDALIDSALKTNIEYICSETQAIAFDFIPALSNPSLFEMEDFEMNVEIKK
ncbi:MAG: isoleucine--tRNA ligase [Bacteroidetes bacterium]|nr:MAG: isoleucine--tRNA ligase [Bacteroidota bacterium]